MGKYLENIIDNLTSKLEKIENINYYNYTSILIFFYENSKLGCKNCNEEHDRDINAAMNILNEGLKYCNLLNQ